MKPVKSASFFAIAASALLMLSSGAYGADLLVGNWKMNTSKSSFNPQTLALVSSTMRVQVLDRGTRFQIDSTNTRNGRIRTTFTTVFDGKESSAFLSEIDGGRNGEMDQIVWTRIDDNNYEATTRLSNQSVTTTRVVISADGKTQTHTVVGRNNRGQVINNTLVYEKQD